MSGGGGDGAGVKGDKAAKSLTATPLDICKETLDQFPAEVGPSVARPNQMFLGDLRSIPAMFVVTKTGI